VNDNIKSLNKRESKYKDSKTWFQETLAEDIIPTIRYAVHSKKGFSRMIEKPNQDSFIVKENLTSNNVHMFSVMDGHGSDGHFVAQYVSKELPH